MKKTDSRWMEYYTSGKYKGFHPKNGENKLKLTEKTHLAFTNGEKELFVTGDFREEALLKMFDRIDTLVRTN